MEQYASDINDYLIHEIGVQDTNFENPHGLFDAEHVTTAADIAKITQYAMKNKLFRDIFGTEELEWKGESWDTTLITHHKLMREIPYEGITGGKTGFVNKSGFTLTTTGERDNLSLVVVTLNSYLKSGAYSDTINLLDYAFENYKTTKIQKDTKFIVNKQEYKTTKDLYFTYSRDDQVSKKVKDNGVLQIVNQDNIVIDSFTLEKNEKKDNKMNTGGSEKVNNLKANSLYDNFFSKPPIFIFLFVLLGMVFYRLTRKYTKIR